MHVCDRETYNLFHALLTFIGSTKFRSLKQTNANTFPIKQRQKGVRKCLIVIVVQESAEEAELNFDSALCSKKAQVFVCVKIPPSTTRMITSFMIPRRRHPFLTRKTNPYLLTKPFSSLHNKGLLFSSNHFPISRSISSSMSFKIIDKF